MLYLLGATLSSRLKCQVDTTVRMVENQVKSFSATVSELEQKIDEETKNVLKLQATHQTFQTEFQKLKGKYKRYCF